MAGEDFDEVSLSSSCEIVDGLSETTQDSPQVMFTCMQKLYSLNKDVVVHFKHMYNGGEMESLGDRVGLYKLPRTQPHEHVSSVWIESWLGGVVTISKSALPKEEGDYQFQYLQRDFTVLGISPTFCMVRDDATIVSDKQIPTKNGEKKTKTESDIFCPLSAVTDQKQAVDRREKEDRIDDPGFWKSLCVELRKKITCLKISEELLGKLLEEEKKVNAEVVDANDKQVKEINDLHKQLEMANDSKFMAVNNLRAVIGQGDLARKEISMLRERNAELEEELITIRQEMDEIKIKAKNADPAYREEKINDLVINLEIHQKFLKEKTAEVEVLEEDKSELIDENMETKRKLKDLEALNKSMKVSVEMLENDKLELEKRLNKMSAENISRNEQDSSIIARNGNNDGLDNREQSSPSPSAPLSSEISFKNAEMMFEEIARLFSKCSASLAWKEIGTVRAMIVKERASGKARFLMSREDDSEVLANYSINSFELYTGTDKRVRRWEYWIGSSNEMFLIQFRTEELADNFGQIFTQAKSASGGDTSPSSSGMTEQVSELECPLCEQKFPRTQISDLEIHVEQHDIENMPECPMCGKIFDKKDRLEYQDHVQGHFQLQVDAREQLSLAERGWDLGM